MISTTLQRYVLRETLRVTLLSTVALTGIIFVGMGASLANKGLSIIQLRDFIPYMIAYSFPYALPTGLLVATVFVFGRLSGANEITAIRSSGINLNHVIVPLLILAMLCSAIAFRLNHYLLPNALAKRKRLVGQMIGNLVQSMGPVKQSYELGSYMIYVGRLNPQTKVWENVAVVEYATDEYPATIVMAEQAQCLVDEDADAAVLRLRNGQVVKPSLGKELEGQEPTFRFDKYTQNIPLHSRERGLSDRPKYAALPQLLGKIAVLEYDVKALRANTAYPEDFEHPKQARDAARDRSHAFFRQRNKVSAGQPALMKAVAEAEAAIETTSLILAEKESALNAATETQAGIAENIDYHRSHLDQLKIEFSYLINRDADINRQLDMQRKIKEEEATIETLEKRLAEAGEKLKTAQEECDQVREKIRQEREELHAIQGELDAINNKIKALDDEYQAEANRANEIEKARDLLRAKTEFHFRTAGAFTSLIFVLIGIPLGILSRRGSVLMAFVVSFFAVLILYYPLMAIGKMLSLDGYMVPWMAQWMPTAVVGAIGIVLTVWGIRR